MPKPKSLNPNVTSASSFEKVSSVHTSEQIVKTTWPASQNRDATCLLLVTAVKRPDAPLWVLRVFCFCLQCNSCLCWHRVSGLGDVGEMLGTAVFCVKQRRRHEQPYKFRGMSWTPPNVPQVAFFLKEYALGSRLQQGLGLRG